MTMIPAETASARTGRCECGPALRPVTVERYFQSDIPDKGQAYRLQDSAQMWLQRRTISEAERRDNREELLDRDTHFAPRPVHAKPEMRAIAQAQVTRLRRTEGHAVG